MADWNEIASRGNVEDRRSMGPLALGGGIGIVGVGIVVLLTLLTGGDLGSVLQQVAPTVLQQDVTIQNDEFVGEDPYETFASTVLGSTNDTWNAEFEDRGAVYPEPKLVLFRQATQSSCGVATSEVGPHYCPPDRTIYLDETFFDELTTRFGAQGGDVAQAYVITHEVGHHVQNILGTLNRIERGDNETSIKVELQADCFAGMWANSIRDQGILGLGEIQEAMDAAAAVGDDRIQKTVQGYINPESFTHGTSEQRMYWFSQGYEKGEMDACDTFK